MITENMLIEDLVREYPELIRPLAEKGLVCVACGEPLWGTLGDLARARGVADLPGIIAELNALVSPVSAGTE